MWLCVFENSMNSIWVCCWFISTSTHTRTHTLIHLKCCRIRLRWIYQPRILPLFTFDRYILYVEIHNFALILSLSRSLIAIKLAFSPTLFPSLFHLHHTHCELYSFSCLFALTRKYSQQQQQQRQHFNYIEWNSYTFSISPSVSSIIGLQIRVRVWVCGSFRKLIDCLAYCVSVLLLTHTLSLSLRHLPTEKKKTHINTCISLDSRVVPPKYLSRIIFYMSFFN